jgi:hypothetical protein
MIDSPQVLDLSDAEFRLLVSLWCLASAAETRGTLPYNARTLQRRALPDHTVAEVEQMLCHLIELDLLAQEEAEGQGYRVVRWDEHQYVHASWTPEERRKQKALERERASSTMSQAGRNDVATMSQAVATQRQRQITETEAEADLSSPTIVTKDDGRDRGGGGGENARASVYARVADSLPAPAFPAAAASARSPSAENGEPKKGNPKLTQMERSELRDLTGAVARAAKLTAYDAAALETLVSRYEGHGRAWLLDEACAAADWIASERNKKLKEKQRRMNVAFLRNWFKKSEEGYAGGQHGHATNQSSASGQQSCAIGSASAVSGPGGVSPSVSGALPGAFPGFPAGFPGNGRGRYSGPGSFGGRVEPGSREYWALRRQIREERERQERQEAAVSAAGSA